MPGEKAPLHRFVRHGRGPAVERDPRPLQGIGERARLIDHDRSAGVRREIGGVAGERGNEEGRGA